MAFTHASKEAKMVRAGWGWQKSCVQVHHTRHGIHCTAQNICPTHARTHARTHACTHARVHARMRAHMHARAVTCDLCPWLKAWTWIKGSPMSSAFCLASQQKCDFTTNCGGYVESAGSEPPNMAKKRDEMHLLFDMAHNYDFSTIRFAILTFFFGLQASVRQLVSSLVWAAWLQS